MFEETQFLETQKLKVFKCPTKYTIIYVGIN